jgi:hypothetical protein
MRFIILILIFINNAFCISSAELLFNGNCVTCHFKTQDISAPSIQKVQKVYKKAFPKKDDFVKYMSNWVFAPNSEGSLMHDAIDKYEIMPTLGFEKEYLKDITSYIYDTNFSKETF